jgi:hypothetical protein
MMMRRRTLNCRTLNCRTLNCRTLILLVLAVIAGNNAVAQPAKELAVDLTPAHERYTVQPDVATLFSRPSAWADSILATLTLDEKIGQMLVPQSSSYYQSNDHADYEHIAKLITDGKIGGVIFSRGDVYELAMLTNRFQKLSKLPLLISADMEWGVSMRINRTTEFPHNMAIAATRKSDYAYKVARVIAEEARALGIHQNYAPDVDLNNNPRNPIINTRSFSESVMLTNQMSTAFINGLQSSGMIATAKHFPGHGDTNIDSHKDLPILPFEKARLDALRDERDDRTLGTAENHRIGNLARNALDGNRYENAARGIGLQRLDCNGRYGDARRSKKLLYGRSGDSSRACRKRRNFNVARY